MDFVTVIGPGPIGLLAAQVARAAGCRRVLVVGINVDEKRLAIARGLGFTTINSSEENPVKRTLGETDGIGADVAIVTVGAPQALSQACELVRKGGRILNVGIFSKPVELAVTSMVRREISLFGTFVSTWRNYEQVMALAISKKINLDPLVTHEFQIDQAVSAFEAAKTRDGCKVEFMI
jgi:L-iditol 2-dehydrogenase